MFRYIGYCIWNNIGGHKNYQGEIHGTYCANKWKHNPSIISECFPQIYVGLSSELEAWK